MENQVSNVWEKEKCSCTAPYFLHDENQWEPGHTCGYCAAFNGEAPGYNHNPHRTGQVILTPIQDDLPF